MLSMAQENFRMANSRIFRGPPTADTVSAGPNREPGVALLADLGPALRYMR
jgi:hypothetical protein